jgi:hypothetical protein
MVPCKETAPATIPVVMASEGTGVRRAMPLQEVVFRGRIRDMEVEVFMQTEEEDFMEAVVMHRADGATTALTGSSMSEGSKARLGQSLTHKEA